MAWSTPTAPTAGTTITVAWAVANIIDLLTWLRRMTGNADPTGPNQVVVSSGTTLSAWGQLPDSAMATQKVTRAGDTMTGDLGVTRSGSGSAGTGFLFLGNTGAYLGWDGTNMLATGSKIWTQANDGSGSGLDADTVRGTSGATVLAGLVPAGAVVWFETLAELTAAGAAWARYTAADGRFLVGAGTAGSPTLSNPITFAQATNYGTDWAPVITLPTHDHALGNAPNRTLGAVGGGITIALNTPTATNNAQTTSPTLSILPGSRGGIWGRKT